MTKRPDTVPAPCPDPVDTRDVDETRRKQDSDEEKKRDGAEFALERSIDVSPDRNGVNGGDKADHSAAQFQAMGRARSGMTRALTS